MKNERDLIWLELQEVMRDHGIDPAHHAASRSSETQLLREAALRVVNGEFTPAELGALRDVLGEKLNAAVNQLMATGENDIVRELASLNPYYSVIQPRMIRDSQTPTEDQDPDGH